MNKTLFKISFVVALSMVSASAYAVTDISTSIVLGGGTFSPSNKVDIACISTTTNYAAQSKNTSGDRIMGTNNLDPKMYWTTSTVGATAGDPGSASKDYSSWTTL